MVCGPYEYLCKLAIPAACVVRAIAIVRIWMPKIDRVKHFCNASLLWSFA